MVKLLINSINKLYMITLDLEHFEYNIKKIILFQNDNENNIENEDKQNLFDFINENCYLPKIEEENSINYFIYYNNNGKELNEFINKFLGCNIKNCALLIKNEICNNNDTLYLLNFNKSKTIKICDYIFSPYLYSLYEIRNIRNIKINKIILLPCKIYNNKRNVYGILLIILNFRKNCEMIDYLYKTDKFKPYCICQIIIKKEDEINLEKNIKNTGEKSSEGKPISNHTSNNNIIIIDDDDNNEEIYFLAGGFAIDKKKPLMKLYDLNNNKELKPKIKFIQDVEIEDCENFSGAIICIIQSDNTGNIFALSLNGGIQNFCIYKKNSKK